ncbi:MAG: ankyrin repeat domain-containing protein [Lentisphaeria bacterium]|nr:ankyrin repeat domain-containing protein [Lentisphaeria bacterium]
MDELHTLIKNSSVAVFKQHITNIKQDDLDKFLDSCLLISAALGRLDIIKVIYEEFNHYYSGDEECYPNCTGKTPLLRAAENGFTDIVKYLLEHDANPFAVDSHGCNAAMNAIMSGNVELAQFLIKDCKVAWQGYTWEGTSALQFALLSGSPRMFGFVLSLGGLEYNNSQYSFDDEHLLQSVNGEYQISPKQRKMLHGKFTQILDNHQKNDCSAICVAAEYGDLHKVKQLISSFEYPIIPESLVCAACKGGSYEIFHYFVDEMQLAVPEQALAYAVTGANEKLVAELIYEHKQNIYQTSANAKTLLHIAVKNGHSQTKAGRYETRRIIREHLLEWGQLDVNAVSCNGSVLDLACQNGDIDIIKLLVDLGAFVDIDAFCSAASCNNVEVMKFLLQSNSSLSVDMQKNDGTTALHEAVKAGATDSVSFLLEQNASTDLMDNDGVTATDLGKMFSITLSAVK